MFNRLWGAQHSRTLKGHQVAQNRQIRVKIVASDGLFWTLFEQWKGNILVADEWCEPGSTFQLPIVPMESRI